LEERIRRPGGLGEEAEGGGGGPSPPADEELQRGSIGVRRLSLSLSLSLSLDIWTGEWSIGVPDNLNCLVSLPPTPKSSRFPPATMDAQAPLFLPPGLASARGSARLPLNRSLFTLSA
jgi:hypothetical protein